MVRWKELFGRQEGEGGKAKEKENDHLASSDLEDAVARPPKWSLGILSDRETDEVPGSVVLLSKANKRNEPLGLQYAPARTSSSSLPSPYPPGHKSRSSTPVRTEIKKTPDGKFVLEPQPDDSHNDPLNWPLWRRNAALLSLGYYCMLGGGMTPILAAGFNNVAQTYNVSVPRVALTTGLYMMGLGVGSVIMSPTAILYGKRPVYLVTSIMYILTSVWCALSPNYHSLLVARILQGISVSPVECLPSATIAEIFFLHESAYRIGIYTLLLLGGKNLVPLVSAVIIEALDWRWTFWIVSMAVGLGFTLLFLFVGETFWDRTPRPSKNEFHLHIPQMFRSHSRFSAIHQKVDGPSDSPLPVQQVHDDSGKKRKHPGVHVAFDDAEKDVKHSSDTTNFSRGATPSTNANRPEPTPTTEWNQDWGISHGDNDRNAPMPDLRNLNSPWYEQKAHETDYFSISSTQDSSAPTAAVQAPTEAPLEPTNPQLSLANHKISKPVLKLPSARRTGTGKDTAMPSHTEEAPTTMDKETLPMKGPSEKQPLETRTHKAGRPEDTLGGDRPPQADEVGYTDYYRQAPPKTFWQTLRPYSGRLTRDKWLRVAVRPFILFAYPAILWSALVYSLSIGWLIVLSESMSTIYKSRDTYNFTSLQTGLVYLSPFVGGVLGTAVAGKLSDVVVRFMARRNDGVYEPEFRLVMALPVAISTTIGLMGFGWSAAEHDKWIVPTIFFGVISFGCSLGSTTSITFAVDSYRQYAGEALVTLNFSKNIFHGLVFSLFFTHWLESDGSKRVFIAIGGIQMACLLFTIPMYIYGKRARMWTVRKNFMEKF